MNRLLLARSISVAGHPAVVMPLSAFGRAFVTKATPSLAIWAGAAASLVAALVLVYSSKQVSSGAWDHMDASQPKERVRLNVVLTLLLLCASLVVHGLGAPKPIALGLALSGAIVLLALLLRHQLKLSLHVGFAVLATALWWPFMGAVGIGLALSAGVSWSRLALKRHSTSEVAAGVVAGGIAGAAFHYWVAG